MCGRRRSAVANGRGAWDVSLGRSELGPLFGLRRRGLGLGARRFLSAQDRHPCRFGTLSLRSGSLLLLNCVGRGLSSRCFRGSVFFSGGLDIGCFAASPNRGFARDGFRNDHRLGWHGGHSSATTGRRCWRGLLFGAGALFPFPAGADASHLVVGEHAHVASNRNVHMPKKRDYLFGWNREFVRQLTD